jgi:hypothetical protein
MASWAMCSRNSLIVLAPLRQVEQPGTGGSSRSRIRAAGFPSEALLVYIARQLTSASLEEIAGHLNIEFAKDG